MDTFTILYFASANTFTKKKEEKLPAPLVLSKLFETLEERYPGIKTKLLSSSALTVNLEYVDLEENADDFIIKSGDEVAIIPPKIIDVNLNFTKFKQEAEFEGVV